MKWIGFIIGLLGVVAATGCTKNPIDLSRETARQSIERTHSYPRNTYVVVNRNGYGKPWQGVSLVADGVGPNPVAGEEVQTALLEFFASKGWMKVEVAESSGEYWCELTNEGAQVFKPQDMDNGGRPSRYAARFGTARMTGITGISGAPGAAQYNVEYSDRIGPSDRWRLRSGRDKSSSATPDSAIVEISELWSSIPGLPRDLTTNYYCSIVRYDDGWRVAVSN